MCQSFVIRHRVFCNVGHTSVAGDMKVSRKGTGHSREFKVAPRIVRNAYSSLTETGFCRGHFYFQASLTGYRSEKFFYGQTGTCDLPGEESNDRLQSRSIGYEG